MSVVEGRWRWRTERLSAAFVRVEGGVGRAEGSKSGSEGCEVWVWWVAVAIVIGWLDRRR